MYSTNDTLHIVNKINIEPVSNIYEKAGRLIPDRFDSTSSPSELPLLPEELNSITKLKVNF